jgi:hypothetical protein
MTPSFLQKLDQNSFAVEASFTPTPQGDLVNFPDQVFSAARGISERNAIKNYRTVEAKKSKSG